jgi:DNA-binding LacI/PurR family transcriptional regulator
MDVEKQIKASFDRPKRVTSRDVAREAGVSQSTVSFVLNNDPRHSIPEETRLRVINAARKLEYHPYAPARTLRMGKSKIVLVVWPEAAVEEGVSQLIDELTGAVAPLGFSLVWQIGISTEHEQLAANLAPAVVVGLVNETNTALSASLHRYQVPVVTLAGGGLLLTGPRLQVEYLIQQGSRSIVYAATDKPQLQDMCRARLEIVRQACREHGVPEPQVVTIPQSREKARQAIADLLKAQPAPFALCAYNDDVAFAALAALSDLHIAVPDSVRVIGHDNTRIAELCIPPLTTVSIASSDLIRQLIASVVSILQGGPVLEIETPQSKVIVRSSA